MPHAYVCKGKRYADIQGAGRRLLRVKNFCYVKLVKHHRELGVPWTDPAFPPSDASVGAAKVRQLGRKVEWKRPSVSAEWVVEDGG